MTAVPKLDDVAEVRAFKPRPRAPMPDEGDDNARFDVPPPGTQQASAQPIPLRWHGDGDPHADRAWLVRDTVFEAGTGLLAGQWGTGKTFIGLDLSASAMTGAPFAGRRVARRGGVLFIAPEGAFEIPIRLRGLVQGKLNQPDFQGQVTDPDHLPFAWIEECPRLLDVASIPILKATCRDAADRMRGEFGVDLVLIIIDTVAAGAQFDDENSASEAQKVVGAMSELSRATGAFVLGVDHFGKAAETGTRGSSGKDAGVDVVLAALGERDMAGNVSNTRMAVRKLRGGRVGRETPYDLEVIEVGRNREDEPITTCVVGWREDRGGPDPKSKTGERWPQSLRVFRTAMSAALSEHCKPSRPFGAEGAEVSAVAEAKVRAEFVASYPVDGDTEAKRAEAKKKAFTRAMKAARDRELIASREIGGVDHLWFVDAQDQ